MPDRNIIDELKQLLRQRGQITKEQREYAETEVKAMMDMYPLARPAEEVRHSHLRTLERYIGDQAVRTIEQCRGDAETYRQAIMSTALARNMQ